MRAAAGIIATSVAKLSTLGLPGWLLGLLKIASATDLVTIQVLP